MNAVERVKATVMIVEDEAVIANGLKASLERNGYKAKTFFNASESLSHLGGSGEPLPNVVLMDINLPGEIDGIAAADVIAKQYGCPVIFLTGFERADYCERAAATKPFAYFVKPVRIEHLMMSIDAAARIRLPGERGTSSAHARGVGEVNVGIERRLVGRSPAVLDMRNKISVLGPSDLPVLVIGETGTGKEIIARELLLASARKDKPYIAVNCASLGTLADSELFGHALGAFTGATHATSGHIGSAAGGTLFFDEVEALTIDVQAKLLRFLDSGEYCKVGESIMRKADVRIFSASNKDLESLCREGKFRQDLFYRLAGAIIRTTRLDDRREDIPLLVQHFLSIHEKNGRRRCTIEGEAMNALCSFDWPGNVRQLRQAVHLLCEHHPGGIVAPEDVSVIQGGRRTGEVKSSNYQEAKERLLEDFDKHYFVDILTRSNGSLKKSLELTGMHKRNFYKKLKKLGLSTKDFK